MIALAVVQASALVIYVGDFGYTVNADKKEAVIENYIGNENDVLIPEYLYEYRIVGVKRGAFADPDGVTLCFASDSEVYRSSLEQQLHCVLLINGDVNLDGHINVCDVTEIQRFLAEYSTLSKPQKLVADVNFDGSITIDDATAIQEYLAELRPLPTRESGAISTK